MWLGFADGALGGDCSRQIESLNDEKRLLRGGGLWAVLGYVCGAALGSWAILSRWVVNDVDGCVLLVIECGGGGESPVGV